MGSRDERIVEMKFDNAQFERGVAQTQHSLNSLNTSLQMTNGATAFSGISNAAKKVDLMYIANNVDNIAQKFTLMGVIGMKVMDEIAMYSINVVKNVWNATFGQIKSGGIKRAMNIENAHFMLQGLLKDEQEVQRIMGLASESVDGTAYSYDAAAKAASQFAASGIIGNEELATSLRAITGVAAMTNSEYEDISRIFTTVAGNGRLMGDQLLQLSSRGMNAAATLVDFFNGVNDGSKTASESVTAYVKEVTGGAQVVESDIRDMVSKGQISFEAFSAAMDEAFGEHAKKANETFTGAMSNVKAALSRIGAKFVSPLIEQNGALVQMFNSLRLMINAINKEMDPFANAFVGAVKDAANGLKYFMDNFNVSDLFKGFAELLRITQTLLSPIGKAFREAFIVTDSMKEGVNTIDRINAAVTRFKEKLESIKPYHATITKIKNTFAGLFAIVKIGAQIISALLQVLLPVKDAIGSMRLGILDMTSSIGVWLVNLEKMLKESNFFVEVFSTIRDVIGYALGYISDVFGQFLTKLEPFKEGLTKIFTDILEKIKGINFGETIEQIRGIFTGELSPENIGESTSAIQKLYDILVKLKQILGKVKDAVFDFVTGFGSAVDTTSASSFAASGLTYILNGLSEAIRLALELVARFGGAVRKGFGSFLEDLSWDKIKDLLTSGVVTLALVNLSKAFDTFTAGLWKDDLMAIAKAIGILTLSLIGLSLIDTDKLGAAIATITLLFTELTAAYLAMTNGITIGDGVKNDPLENKLGRFLGKFTGLISIGGMFSAIRKKFEMEGIKKIAEAILVLTGALWVLSTIDPVGLAKGLTAITILFAELTLLTKAIQKVTGAGNLGVIGAGILAISAAVAILTVALKSLANMKMDEVINGAISLGMILGEVVVFTKLMKGNGLSGNASTFIGLATGILIMSVALEKIGSLPMSTIAKGLGGIAGALVLVVAALKLLAPGTSVLQNGDIFMVKQQGELTKAAGAITLIAVAMNLFAKALKSVGGMDWEQIAKGLVGIAGTMLITLAAFNYIDNDNLIRTASALVIVGNALIIFGVALRIIGTMDLAEVAKGLLGIAGAMAVVVAALKLLTSGSDEAKLKDIFMKKDKNGILKAAAAITIMAAAMNLMAVALRVIGTMSLGEVTKGLIGMAGGVAVVVAALKVLNGTEVLDAAAFAIAAAALSLLIPPFIMLGSLSLEQIVKALVAMAGAMLVFKAAAYGMGGMAEDLVAISSAMALFGLGVTAVGVGVLALAAGLQLLITTIASIPGSIALLSELVVTVVSNIITTVADTIGYLMVGVAKGIVACVEYLANNCDTIVNAITTIFTAVITALVELIAGAVYLIIETIAETLERLAASNSVGRLVDGFFTIIHQVLIALETHVDEFVTDVVRLFVLVIYSLIKNLGTILSACVAFVVQFVKGLAAIIVEQSGPIVEAINDIVLSIAYLLIEVLKELVSVIPGLGDLIGSGLEDAQGWIINHMSEENGQKIIEDWANGVDTGIQQAGDKWAASARHAALLVTAEARNALSAWDIRGAKEDIVGFQTARLEPDAYYYNRVGRASYNPEQDYSSTVQPRNTYKGSNYQLDAITKDSKTNIMDSVSNMGQGATDVLKGSLGDWGSVADESADDFTNRILKNADNAANATDYMGQVATGSLTYYIPMYGETGSKSIIEYGSMILAGTDRTVKASDKVAGASVGKIAEYYSRYSSTGTQNVDAYIASVYAGQGKASSAGGGVGNANVSGLASVNPRFMSTGSDAIGIYASGITGAAGKSVSAAAQVASSSATSVGQKKDDFWDAGNQATIGFANGITEMISRAISAAGNVARAALNQLKAVLGIHSPSKEFMKAGEYSGEGYIIGLQHYQDAIERESGDLASLSIKAFSDGMLAISEIADSNSTFEPEIRPVLDLSNVNNGMTSLNDILQPGGSLDMHNTLATTVDMTQNKDDIWRIMVDENAKHEANLRKIIESQNEILASIKRGVTNQKIVLDSGELVGQTIEKIDNALEERAVRVGRGN